MALDIDSTIKSAKFKKVHDILSDTKRKFIVVDGVIGAGKTTLISLIEKTINSSGNVSGNASGQLNGKIKVKAIFEPVDVWNETKALQYFYEDIAKNCYEFQTYTYITRISRVIDEIYNCQDADIYILERSIFTDRYIFMELLRELVGDMRMTMYNQWCEMWGYIMPLQVSKWVLLNTSLDESLRRISLRNRDGETSGISVEYQTSLYDKHIEFYDKLKEDGENVVIINSDIMDTDFLLDETKIKNIIDKIID